MSGASFLEAIVIGGVIGLANAVAWIWARRWYQARRFLMQHAAWLGVRPLPLETNRALRRRLNDVVRNVQSREATPIATLERILRRGAP